MPVYKKLHKLQAATRSLSANAEGQTGSARYSYVSGAKLLGTIRPKMDELGLILTQEVLDIRNEPITYMTRNGEKTEMFTTAHIRFTWVDTEDDSTFSNDFFANGMNAWDKGLGSALTYAERYYLMKTFHIATDEDDIDALVKDEAISGGYPEKTSGRTRITASQAPAKPAASPAPEKTSGTAKKVVTDKNIKQIVDWVCQVPEGPNRDERVKKAEASYEWPGNLLEAFRAMVDLSE